ncbi:uncharacterized protein SPPG_00702 [Spizellomyces punctatus DAOM BR117]|uniref:Adenylate kinase n=1 Tax=Spizellomyces punctatus (strain DAOM BR117) TaxID=645134 RepID=A0A0L0HVA9_SPIPD|nr:uncharacterized protein SPPG_00702 [Spizellomyces punctatus DAOM BR117]KND05022.1 hypothetical protein SPPG_00702 [Spizellomyces punctatus DAOM BR117]|eukprot:XP_016613061.1 hypothetical protein SPPG_00702 [Spizellomyces punctatus DAOM BR117]
MNELLPKDRAASLASYADKHELFDLFQSITSRMVMDRPDDVIQFLIEQLQKPTAQGIAVIGPPSSGQAKIAEQLALHLDAVHISAGRLLATAIERQTSLGTQARPYLERGEYVPDNVMLGLVTARLQDPEVGMRGFVLEGFPRTKEQAKGLISRGILPERVVVFDIPDETIVSRLTQTRIDPITNRMYHLTLDPPPQNPTILSRLIQRSTDTEAAVRTRLNQYRRHLFGIYSSFDKECLRKLVLPDGIIGHEEEALKEVISEVGKGRVTRAPRMMKVIVGGLPGSGKTSVARMIEKEFAVVCVSPRTVILEELSLGTGIGKELANYANNPDDAPDDQILQLIANRLKRQDCVDRGWVLDGYPRTKAQADALAEKGILPNRVLLLRVSPETCYTRLTQRRYDPLTNRMINLATTPHPEVTNPLHYPSTDPTTWPIRPIDTPSAVQNRLQTYPSAQSELSAAYGGGRTVSRQGRAAMGREGVAIVQAVDAEGVESEDVNGIVPGMERVFERVRGALMRGGNIAVEKED